MSAGRNGAEPAEETRTFSLDALERDDTKEPFPFEAGGRTWHIGHPDDLDYRAQERLAAAETNADVLAVMLGDQYPDFAALDITLPVWKIEALFEALDAYFGISLPESPASPAYSNRAARRSRRTSAPSTASGSPTSARV